MLEGANLLGCHLMESKKWQTDRYDTSHGSPKNCKVCKHCIPGQLLWKHTYMEHKGIQEACALLRTCDPWYSGQEVEQVIELAFECMKLASLS